MSYFVMPYRVLFHDTMAYGSHHFLANFKFQCEAREQMFFEHVVEASEDGRRDHEDLVLLTQQAYSRNLAPVAVGRKVAILVSAEEFSRSSVRFCFRVVREDGAPVSCGFQTLVCTSRRTGGLVPAPPSILRGSELMRERLVEPDFAQRVLTGRLRRVFDRRVLDLAVGVAGAPPERSYPRFVDEAGAELRPGAAAELTVPGAGVVFTFPGQGSFSLDLLRRLGAGTPAGPAEGPALLGAADEVCRRLLGAPFRPLVEAATDAEAKALVAACPDLVQVGIYLGAVLAALELRRRGVEPDLLVGHSAGELAALAVAGAYRPEAGLELVCQRALALAAAGPGSGGMTAVFAAPERVLALLEGLQPSSLEVAVVNHDEQVVVSGAVEELERLEAAAAAAGLGRHRLQSPYPFHARLMAPARARFERALAGRSFARPRLPVYSPIDRRAWDDPGQIGRRLAGHLVRPLDFAAAVGRLAGAGARRFVECGAGGTLTRIVRRVLRERPGIAVEGPFARPGAATGQGPAKGRGREPSAPAPRPASGAVEGAVDGAPPLPIAVVGRGCVLPGAGDVDGLWRSLLERRSGIVDAAALRPDLARDFLAGSPVAGGGPVPDKTYTLLGGFITDEALDPAGLTGAWQGGPDLPWTAEELARLGRAQRFLALALARCAGPRTDGGAGVKVFLGATADGIVEYDEALLAAGLEELAAEVAAGEELAALRAALAAAVGRSAGELPERAPWAGYLEVVRRLVGEHAALVTVDAACASSLYSIVLGLEALRRGECDLALCGGVFAPGPANSCLFSQFQGLSATGSRPLDVSADGVVFGEGAAMLALRRLPDALAAGEPIHAVIAGSGLSSDGRSPSAAVPRREGQVLAMRRAYRRAGIDPRTVQYLEAHATATPVGDAVEVAALTEVFGGRDGRPPIELGSVKALLGHTGWVAGAASVLKVCGALEHRTVPPQAGFERPGPEIDLESGGFAVSTALGPWPDNGAEPRRAGVNAFGFGGSNAHLIVEDHRPGYHARVVERAAGAAGAAGAQSALAVVGIGALFPDGGATAFDRAGLAPPPGVRILPDIVDDMDAGQLLAMMAAARALDGLGDGWRELHEEIGVVLGIEGKSERALEANRRIYLDRLERRLRRLESPEGLDRGRLAELAGRVAERVRRLRPSGPYTLPGLMPNVAAGRVASAFNLRGPNLALSAGDASLPEAFRVAADLLARGEAAVVLAGGLSACAGAEADRAAGRGRPVGEAALVLALTTRRVAGERGFPVLAEVTLGSGGDSGVAAVGIGTGGTGPYLAGTEGAAELARALESVRRGEAGAELVWPRRPGQPEARLRIAEPGEAERRLPDHTGAPGELPPIYRATPSWRPAPLTGAPAEPQLPRRPLVLVDGTVEPAALRAALAAAGAAEPVFLCPAGRPVAGALAVDPGSDAGEGLAPSRAAQARAGTSPAPTIPAAAADGILVVRDLSGIDGAELLAEAPPGAAAAGLELLDLLFTCARRLYPALEDGAVPLGVLLLGAADGDRLHPSSGPFSGFVKALARELPRAACKAVVTDGAAVAVALPLLAAEIARGPLPAAPEVLYRRGVRHESRLVRLPALAGAGEPWLDSDSVVLATGGARGVTAELAAELLERFGCTVVLAGRTDPDRLPDEIRAMDDDAFRRFEAEYYRRELGPKAPPRPVGEGLAPFRGRAGASPAPTNAPGPPPRPVAEGLAPSRARAGASPAPTNSAARSKAAPTPRELRARYGRWRAAREVLRTVESMRAGPGRVEYRVTDLTDPAAADRTVAAVAAEHGRLDLVVHGAGLQASKRLSRKSLDEFRGIVAAKLGGLANLHRACRRHLAGRDVRFHLLTSAFSVFGNDGQPDYGSANEAMNRLAAWAGGPGDDRWTALAWLGWAAVGMTRGSEYAALARARGLRPVTPREGRELFAELVGGRPRQPVSVLVADGELAHYGLELTEPRGTEPPAPAPAAGETELTWDLALDSHPWLADHLVGGRPTLPGTFEAELAARVACALRPGAVAAMADTELLRFVKLDRAGRFRLRGRGRVVEDRADGSWVEVQLLSDFVHASGRVLRRDIPHFASRIWVTRSGKAPDGAHSWAGRGGSAEVADPYLSPASPVRLGGLFRCLERIELAAGGRRARFRVRDAGKLESIADFLTPAVLLDGLFRCAMIHLSPAGRMPVYVPIRSRRTLLAPGVNDAGLHAAGAELTLTASEPRPEGETVRNDWAQVTDAGGRVILRVEDLVARRAGEVEPELRSPLPGGPARDASDLTREGDQAHG